MNENINPVQQLAEDESSAPLPYIHADCPACGYAPLLIKTVASGDRVTFNYWCAFCHNKFNETHKGRVP